MRRIIILKTRDSNNFNTWCQSFLDQISYKFCCEKTQRVMYVKCINEVMYVKCINAASLIQLFPYINKELFEH